MTFELPDIWELGEAIQVVLGHSSKGGDDSKLYELVFDKAKRAILGGPLKGRPMLEDGETKYYVRPCDFIFWAHSSKMPMQSWAMPLALQQFCASSDSSKRYDGLTVTQAARLFIKEMSGKNYSLDSAKSRISKACNEGKIKCEGNWRSRRIDLESLKAYILDARDAALEEE